MSDDKIKITIARNEERGIKMEVTLDKSKLSKEQIEFFEGQEKELPNRLEKARKLQRKWEKK